MAAVVEPTVHAATPVGAGFGLGPASVGSFDVLSRLKAAFQVGSRGAGQQFGA